MHAMTFCSYRLLYSLCKFHSDLWVFPGIDSFPSNCRRQEFIVSARCTQLTDFVPGIHIFPVSCKMQKLTSGSSLSKSQHSYHETSRYALMFQTSEPACFPIFELHICLAWICVVCVIYVLWHSDILNYKTG